VWWTTHTECHSNNHFLRTGNHDRFLCPFSPSLSLKLTRQALDRRDEPRLDRPTTDPIALPDEVTSPQAKLVYLYLLVRGTVTVDELGASLGLPKLALFSILQTLAGYGLVIRESDAVSPA
jgi:hypothetical protein